MARNYAMRNVIRNVLGTEWLIHPDKLEDMLAMLESRANGDVPSEEELRAKFGAAMSSDEDEPQIVDGIQVIDVAGTLAPRMNLMMRFSGGTSTQKLAQQIRSAASDDGVKTLLLRVDSPGGAASYTPEVAQAIRQAAETKRVVTSATNMMASAAYWIGTAADEVFASPSTEIGSIGVYTILTNVVDAAEKSGQKFEVVRAGSLKAAGNPYEPLTDERRQAIQDRIDAVYEQFISSVAQQRNTTSAIVKSTYGQGTVFLAGAAAQRGMIDGVATFEEVFARERHRLTSSGTVTVPLAQENKMDPKLKAALFARGIIDSIDCDDSLATAAKNAFLKARGESPTLSDDESIAVVLRDPEPVAAAEPSDSPEPLDPRRIAEQERLRITDLQDRARVLGVSDELLTEAIESNLSVADALIKWTDHKAETNRPVAIVPGEAEYDKFSAGASAALAARYAHLVGDLTEEETRDLQRYGGGMQNMTMLDMARQALKSHGVRVTGDRITDANNFLRLGGGEMAIQASSAVNRRGDHPALVDNLANKALNQGAVIAPVTYSQWTDRIEDLPDFKPKSFIDVGVFKRLDLIEEAQATKELQFNSEFQNWIQADRYADKVALTTEMVTDDDLGGFTRQLRSLGTASQMSVNAVILDLFTSNPTMPDGNAFFSAAHLNDITSGSAPSDAQLQTHREKHRLNKSFGSDFPMGLGPDRLLAPAALETETLQTIAFNPDQKVANTDGTINTFRGTISPIIESHLDGYDAVKWYTFVRPSIIPAVVYAFQTGYGANGRRTTWFDQDTQCRYVRIETRFGVALANHRAVVRNAGA